MGRAARGWYLPRLFGALKSFTHSCTCRLDTLFSLSLYTVNPICDRERPLLSRVVGGDDGAIESQSAEVSKRPVCLLLPSCLQRVKAEESIVEKVGSCCRPSGDDQVRPGSSAARALYILGTSNLTRIFRTMDDHPTPMPMIYSDEPPHSKLLDVQAHEPYNAEPTAAALCEFPVTPEDLVYCRNHGPVREFEEGAYRLKVGGLVKQAMDVGVQELRSGLGAWGRKDVVAALQVRAVVGLGLGLFVLLLMIDGIFSVRVSGGMRWALSRK